MARAPTSQPRPPWPIGPALSTPAPDLAKDLRQELESVFDEGEERGHVGEHAGHDERIFGVVAQHGLQQLDAPVYR